VVLSHRSQSQEFRSSWCPVIITEDAALSVLAIEVGFRPATMLNQTSLQWSARIECAVLESCVTPVGGLEQAASSAKLVTIHSPKSRSKALIWPAMQHACHGLSQTREPIDIFLANHILALALPLQAWLCFPSPGGRPLNTQETLCRCATTLAAWYMSSTSVHGRQHCR
jgi:hypothetical protein